MAKKKKKELIATQDDKGEIVLRDANEQLSQQQKDIELIEKSLEETRRQHLQIAKLLTARGIQAIQQQNAPIYKAKEALDYIREGIELERKVLNMETQNVPQVVNIIANQQQDIDEFVEEVEVEDHEPDNKEN